MHFATPSYRTVKNRAVAAEEPGILICERQRLRKPNRLPSDIKPESFATALIGVVALDKAGKHAFELTAAEVRETVAKIDPNNPVRGLLLRTARRRLVRCRNGPGRGLVQAAGDLVPAGGGGGQKADQQGSGVDHAGVSSYFNSLVNLIQCLANCTKSSAARLAWSPGSGRGPLDIPVHDRHGNSFSGTLIFVTSTIP